MTPRKDDASTEKREDSGLHPILEQLAERASRVLAELQAADPAAIDVRRRMPYLHREAIKWLISIEEELTDDSRAALEEWREAERRRNRELMEALEQSARRFHASLPPNWHNPEIEFPDQDVLEGLQLDEGLPLAWLPPNPVLAAMLEAGTPDARVEVLSAHDGDILDACESALRILKAPLTEEWRVSALEATQTLKAGKWRAGQALAAITLDTALEEFVRKQFEHATRQTDDANKPMPPGSGKDGSLPGWMDINYPRALLVFYGVWGAFKKYRVKKGDELPTGFTRNGTVHSMSGKQYTKPNVLIAIMHATSLLILLEEMMTDTTRGAD